MPPWVSEPHTVGVNLDPLRKKNILLQIVLDKFSNRDEFDIYDNFDNREDYIVPPNAKRNIVDTARNNIIKLLLENGAIFDEETIDTAFGMRDWATVQELEKKWRSPFNTSWNNFWHRDRLSNENARLGRYCYQEINGEVTDTYEAFDLHFDYLNDCYYDDY